MAASNDEKNVETKKKLQKSYFDVLGLCCSSEVPLIENILKALEGVKDVSVIVPSRTVIVVHDNLLVSQLQIVKALNQARLEANVRLYGETNYKKKWPSPYTIICGVLLLLSLFKYVYHPFQWLAIGAVAVGILPIALRGIAAIRNLTLDINILALIAVVGTIFLKDYLEAATIVFLFTIAEWLESRASHKATAVMSSLMNMAPQKAVIAETGEVVAADEVQVNTVVAVKAGEVIPIDGIVVEGKSEVDEKTLTGESFPVPKEENSIVWAGTINLNGYISVITTALAEDCVVAKMAKLVEEAQNSKSKTQRFIDKCAKYYTPAVLCISVGLAVIPAALRVHNENHWFHLALVVLVSGCPCALILSTPVATFCALSQAATSGILIKGGDYLEIMSKIKIMAFDKTGTITRGEFVVTDFRSLHDDDISLNTLLYWVSSIESKSSHPMAPALVEYGRSHSIEPKPEIVEDFQNYPGEGIHGKIGGRDIYVGNRKIALRAGCQTVPTLEGEEDKVGKTIGYVYCGATPAGIFNLSDSCRSGVTEAIQELKSLGIKTAMLTGDSNAAAMQAQEQLGHALELVHAELLPEDKARIIEEFKEDGPTAMIGDGINDAPALATADIGISMGITGSALATETGHVILMSNDIRKIPKAIKLARRCQRKVIQNVVLSITTKAAILALAFAGHPLVWAAVLADVGTCLLVILNSMLLLRGTHKHGGKCNKYSSTSIFHKQGCHDDHSSHAHQHSCYDSAGTKMLCEPEGSYSQRCSSKHECHDDHSAHAHQHSCSDSAGTKKTCEPKGCSFQRCASKHRFHDDHSADVHQHSCSDSPGTKKMSEAKGCSSQRCASKHGCHEDHSAHAHQHSCSHSAGTKKMCEPKVCSSQRCAPNSQSGTSNSSLCEDKTCKESADTTERDVDNGLLHEAEHFNVVTCKDMHNMHNHGCEETPISNLCGVKKCTDSVDMVSCSSLNHLNHAHTSSERGQQKRSHGHLHCSNVKDHKDSDESPNTDEHFHPPNPKVCCGTKKHDTQLSKPLHTTIDIVMSSCHGESSGMHACPSLEKREIDGCCKSFRKESCGKHGHFGTGFGPGLSEIVIE